MAIVTSNKHITIGDGPPDSVNYRATADDGTFWYNKTDNKLYFGANGTYELYNNVYGTTLSVSNIVFPTYTTLGTDIASPLVIPLSGTKSELLALDTSTLPTGATFFIDDVTGPHSKRCVWSGRIWTVPGETVELLANENLVEGTVVRFSSGSSNSSRDFNIIRTGSDSDARVIGVTAFSDVSSGEWVAVAMRGIWPVRCVADTYDKGYALVSSTALGRAREESDTTTDGLFANILQTKTLQADEYISAFIHSTEMF